MKRKYKSRVKRRLDGNRVEVESGGEVNLVRLVLTRVRYTLSLICLFTMGIVLHVSFVEIAQQDLVST